MSLVSFQQSAGLQTRTDTCHVLPEIVAQAVAAWCNDPALSVACSKLGHHIQSFSVFVCLHLGAGI